MNAEPHRCPVCGRMIADPNDLVKVWPGTYAHGECAAYGRRRRRGDEHSQRLYRKFTRT